MWWKNCIHESNRYLVNVISHSVKNMNNKKYILTPNEEYEIKKTIEMLRTPRKDIVVDIQKYKGI